MKDITVILGSVTKASKVKRLLSSEGIKAEIIKSTDKTSGECIHGIKIGVGDMYNAALILRKHGVGYTVENDISR